MHNHTFKPGDLAVVHRCGNSSHIGMVVRIIKPSDFPGFDWSVAILSGPVIGRGIGTGRHGFYSRASVYNWNLMPLGDETLVADEQEAVTPDPCLQSSSIQKTDFRRIETVEQSSRGDHD